MHSRFAEMSVLPLEVCLASLHNTWMLRYESYNPVWWDTSEHLLQSIFLDPVQSILQAGKEQKLELHIQQSMKEEVHRAKYERSLVRPISIKVAYKEAVRSLLLAA